MLLRRAGGERGQAAPEWLGTVSVVAIVLAAVAASDLAVSSRDVARALVSRFACAIGLGRECGAEATALAGVYGPELAAAVAANTPRLDYESGMRAVPVDFRSCREDACAEGAEGERWAPPSRGRR